MTNYMGKRRLLKILLQTVSDRPELQKQIKRVLNLLDYRTYRGSEWLKIWLDDYRFVIYADGERCKAVSFEEYRDDINGSRMFQYNRIITKYNENFEPLSLATWFSGGCALRRRGYYPFHDDDKVSDVPITDNNLDPNSFVCYDISKKRDRTERC